MTELEQLKQDLDLARTSRDRLGREMDILRTAVEGATAEQMRDNINQMRADRGKYTQLRFEIAKHAATLVNWAVAAGGHTPSAIIAANLRELAGPEAVRAAETLANATNR